VRRLVLAAILLLGIAAAQETPPPTEPLEDEDIVVTEDTIAAGEEARQPTDGEVRQRIERVFAAVPALEGASVRVRDGVVILSGTVADADIIATAGNVARQTEGAVVVVNELEADTSVEAQLSPAAGRVDKLVRQSTALLPLLAVAAVVVVVFFVAGLFLARRQGLIRRLARNDLIASLLTRILPLLFLVIGLVIALTLLDAVAILSALLGAAGVVGIAVGFAIRDTIENFIASVMLSVRQPFRPKDYVDIDGKQGFVVRLTSRATILMTADGVSVRIPNANVFKAVVTNYTRNAERRITFVLGIDAEDDPQAAIERGIMHLQELPFPLNDPAPKAWIEEVGDSNIVLTYAFWIDQRETDFFKARSAAIRVVKDMLEEEGFTLPEPIYRLRIDQIPDALKAVVHQTDQPFEEGPAKKSSPKSDQITADTSVDRTVEEKVDEDRAVSHEDDLLNENAPTEFGDDGKGV
jgi:small-conductance mechanosensitive channel